VGRMVRVRNLILTRHEAWSAVEGMLEGVQFGEPQWDSGRKVSIEAILIVPEKSFETLRTMVPRDLGEVID